MPKTLIVTKKLNINLTEIKSSPKPFYIKNLLFLNCITYV